MRTKLFYSEIYLATSTDELRPAFGYIYFKDGYLYATDAYIAVKQSLKIHEFTEEEIEILNGKMIHGNAVKAMKIYKSFEVQQDGILCRGKFGENVLFKYTSEDKVGKYPKVDEVIHSDSGSISKIGINPKTLLTLEKCLVKKDAVGVVLNFGITARQAVIVTISDIPREDQVALIMPVNLNAH